MSSGQRLGKGLPYVVSLSSPAKGLWRGPPPMMACQTLSPRPVPGDTDQPCTNSGPQPMKLTIRFQEQECHHDTTLGISGRLPMPSATQRVFCSMLRPEDLWRTVAMLQSGSRCCLPLSMPVRRRPHVCCGLRVHVVDCDTASPPSWARLAPACAVATPTETCRRCTGMQSWR